MIAATNADGAVTLDVRSLVDGSQRARFAVSDDWEHYQWSDVAVSDAGRVAFRRGAEFGFGGSGGDVGTAELRGGGRPDREIAKARPLGWLGDELVYLDRSKPLDEHGCGLVRVRPM